MLVAAVVVWHGAELVYLTPPVRVRASELPVCGSFQLADHLRDFVALGLPFAVFVLVVKALAGGDLSFEFVCHP